MEMVQFYEATVADRKQGYAFTFLVIPRRSLTGAIQHDDPPAKDELVGVLGLQQLRPVQPSALPQAISGMLRADEEVEELQQFQAQAVLARLLQTAPPSSGTPPALPDLLAFAEQIAFTNLIPFEESPIDLVSLAGKAATLSTNGIAVAPQLTVVPTPPLPKAFEHM